MAYNTLDIIDKVINTAEKIKKMYSDLIMNTKENSSIYILLNVLIKNIDIQGRFVKTQADTNTNTYKILSKLIFQKERKIKDLELFTNGYLDS